MNAQILSRRPGIENRFHWNNDGTFTVETVQDVEPILERNKFLANHWGKSSQGHRDFRHVASIPIAVQYDWAVKYGVRDVLDPEYWPKVRSLLNSSEYRYLRTSEIIL